MQRRISVLRARRMATRAPRRRAGKGPPPACVSNVLLVADVLHPVTLQPQLFERKERRDLGGAWRVWRRCCLEVSANAVIPEYRGERPLLRVASQSSQSSPDRLDTCTCRPCPHAICFSCSHPVGAMPMPPPWPLVNPNIALWGKIPACICPRPAQDRVWGRRRPQVPNAGPEGRR